MIERCVEDFAKANFQCEPEFLRRFVAALAAKRFVILTGLSGSGKTKLAQGFAQWISPEATPRDPFSKGSRIGASYRVMDADRISVEFWNEGNEKVVLPRKLIEEWADFIERHPTLADAGSQEIRTEFKKYYDTLDVDKFAKHAILWDSHLKPAALALLESRKTAGRPCRPFEVVAVGADWISNEHVLGYPDGLDRKRYVRTKTLDLMLSAAASPDVPHFLILDEMNLSHVERYFADLLSAIESGDAIHLHGDEPISGEGEVRSGIPSRLILPENLFIIGTVNIDETTYMFSPKVLDRANVLEFRVSEGALRGFLKNPVGVGEFRGNGAIHSSKLLALARSDHGLAPHEVDTVNGEIMRFFLALQKTGGEFGFRVAKEMVAFIGDHKRLSGEEWTPTSALDAQIVQKVLPKLHGARNKLEPILWCLASLCHTPRPVPPGYGEAATTGCDAILEQALKAAEMGDDSLDPLGTSADGERNYPIDDAYFPLSFDKILRMLLAVRLNGFTSFAEG